MRSSFHSGWGEAQATNSGEQEQQWAGKPAGKWKQAICTQFHVCLASSIKQ